MHKHFVNGACLLLAVLLGSASAGAQDALAELASRLNVLKDAADALGAAGDAIANLTDGVAHLVTTGDSAWETVAARRTHDRLIAISARATNIAGVQQIAVVNSIDAYLAKQHPTSNDWGTVTTAVGGVIGGVKKLLDDLRMERSDFVLDSAYATLVETLGARSDILAKLATLPPATTAEEKAGLARVNANYKRLLAKFQAAIQALNEYVASR
jgi:hypothetical protein